MHPKQYEKYHALGYGAPLREIGRNKDSRLTGLTLPTLPADLESTDVVFLSASGQSRQTFATGKWYQRAWNRIDARIRRLLGG